MRQIQTIPCWAEDDRPREKMMRKGRNALSDAELLAIIIGTGTGSKTAVDLARELLQLANGDLYGFGQLRMSQLLEVKGIGESKAISILAALELGRRRREQAPPKRQKILSSQSAYFQLRPYFSDLLHEEFFVLFLNRNQEMIAIKQLSVGGATGTFVDPKMIFKAALDCSASGIMLAHNHPSGNLHPSPQDKSLTKQIKQFGIFIDIPIVDHLIITDNGYFSFSDARIL